MAFNQEQTDASASLKMEGLKIIDANAELKNALLSSIVEFSDDAIVSKDLNSIVTSWNKGAERVFGYKANEMIGRSILTIIPQERKHEEAMILDKLKNGNHVDHFETVRQRKDGAMVDISLTISALRDKKGNIIGLSKIARDITERKQQEQMKNEFMSMVSHELKTPLTAINSYLQLLLKKVPKVLPKNVFINHALSRAETLSNKMVAMIHNFLNLARLEVGKLELVRNDFDLDELIREIIEDFELLAATHYLKFEQASGGFVNGDKEKISHVIQNLISNAIKYSAPESQIEISTEHVNGKTKVSIADEGFGINPIDQEQLFEKFYRSKCPRAGHVAGFGIGLFLVSQILTLHGSKIHLESEPDKGSTFWFYL
ncbi:PAS domain S-box protein [Pedobacter sp. ASV28]|uniref:PAS domain-containing sensor histidine kinase n=1 Tax=Pedobacter sp. ASV28 TaxID=2795123 RepID=UPI0018ECB3ED|nr:PAS domain S-box protein [Pedobacter sp. ASV28]